MYGDSEMIVVVVMRIGGFSSPLRACVVSEEIIPFSNLFVLTLEFRICTSLLSMNPYVFMHPFNRPDQGVYLRCSAGPYPSSKSLTHLQQSAPALTYLLPPPKVKLIKQDVRQW